MDDGAGDVELAQPGPIRFNYEPPEREPLAWTDTVRLCLAAALSVGIVAGGIVVIMTRDALGPDDVLMVNETGFIVLGSVIIVLGLVTMALAAVQATTEFRRGREVDAMTRLHMVPVSRRP